MYEQLIFASKNGDLELIKKLVDKGVDSLQPVDYDCAVQWASMNGHLNVVHYLVSLGANIHANNDRSFRNAIFCGHLELVRYFVSLGVDIHIDDDFAIIYASENGHVELVRYLVSIGADIRADNDWAIVSASEEGYMDIVRFLADIYVGTSIDYLSVFNKAVRWASRYERLEVAKYFVSLGANINKVENFKIKLIIKIWLEIDRLKHKRRVKALLTILKRFILKRQSVKCIPYLPKIGVEYFKAKESFTKTDLI